MTKKVLRLFFIFWIASFCGLALLNIPGLFVTPLREYGDLALNALQIIEAKNGRELLGNYSRWGFHHPGPFFFYVYAAGEALFYDALKLSPAPLNAHLLAGLILQTGFLALAAACLASLLRDRRLFAGFAVAGAAFFSLCAIVFPGRLFVSIWPPDALLMPFFAFLCCMAAFAAGRAWALAPAAFCAGVLVHGHVAQPGFVLLLILCAAVPAAVAAARGGGGAVFAKRLRFAPAALLAAAPFLFTLAVDASRGGESNLAAVMEYLRSVRETKSFSDALGYVASFFALEPSPELILGYPGARARDAFLRHWPALFMWSCALLSGYFLWRSSFWRRGLRESSPAAALFFLAAAVLIFALFWAANQTGPMYQFNAHFLYAPICALLALPAGLVWGGSRPARAALSVMSGLLAALSVVLGGWQINPAALGESADVDTGLIHGKAAGLPRDANVFVFGADRRWPDAAAFVLAAIRGGADARVAPELSYMFGKKRVVFPGPGGSPPHFHFFQITTQGCGQPPVITGGFKGIRPAEFPEIRPGAFHIQRFTSETLDMLPSVGLSLEQSGCVWTNGPRAGIWFRPAHAAGDVLLRMELAPFKGAEKPLAQRIRFSLNGESLGERMAAGPGEIVVAIPRDKWNRSAVSCLELGLPDCVSPRQLRLGLDFRKLGVSISSLSFDQAESGRVSGR